MDKTLAARCYWKLECVFVGASSLKNFVLDWKTGIQVITMAFALVAPLSQAAGVAVFNPQKALEESAPAKAFEKTSKAKFSGQIDRLKKLETQIRTSVTNFERDSATMSEAARTKKQMEIRRKQEDYQIQRRDLEVQIAQAQQKELQRLAPKLRQAVDSVAKAGGYDVVVESRGISYVKPGLDITAKVITKLNALAK